MRPKTVRERSPAAALTARGWRRRCRRVLLREGRIRRGRWPGAGLVRDRPSPTGRRTTPGRSGRRGLTAARPRRPERVLQLAVARRILAAHDGEVRAVGVQAVEPAREASASVGVELLGGQQRLGRVGRGRPVVGQAAEQARPRAPARAANRAPPRRRGRAGGRPAARRRAPSRRAGAARATVRLERGGLRRRRCSAPRPAVPASRRAARARRAVARGAQRGARRRAQRGRRSAAAPRGPRPPQPPGRRASGVPCPLGEPERRPRTAGAPGPPGVAAGSPLEPVDQRRRRARILPAQRDDHAVPDEGRVVHARAASRPGRAPPRVRPVPASASSRSLPAARIGRLAQERERLLVAPGQPERPGHAGSGPRAGARGPGCRSAARRRASASAGVAQLELAAAQCQRRLLGEVIRSGR